MSKSDPGAATLAMIIRCYQHQHPEEYGRRPVFPPVYTARPAETVSGFDQTTIHARTDRGRDDHVPLPRE